MTVRGFSVRAALAALVAAPLAVLLALAAFGIPVSAAPWRDGIAAVASAALGRTVTLEGPIELVLGFSAALRVGGIRIANPPGFATPAFADLGAARAEVDLFPALAGRLRIRTLEAANGKLWLERTADGRRNWIFDALAQPPGPEDDEAGIAVRIERMRLRDLALEHHAGGRVRYFDLDALDAEGAWARPVGATVRGRVEKAFPYVLTLAGGPGRALYRGDEPWPFTLDLEFAGTRGHANGALHTGTDEAELLVGLGTENLAEVERLLQTRLPKVGVTSIAAQVAARAGRVKLTGIRGVMGASELAGALEVTLAGDRPRVTGELDIATLDLRPFLAGDPAQPGAGNRAQPAAGGAAGEERLELDALTAADADVRLRIDRWLGLPGEVREVRLDARIDNGRLTAPLEANVADVPLAGRLALDGSAAVPALSLELGA